MYRSLKTFRLLVLIFILGSAIPGITQEPEIPYSYEQQLDLNNASYEEIARLPIPAEIAEKIYYRIEYQGPFSSFFQLREIEGLDQEMLLTLKPLVRIEPYQEKSERESRVEQLYYRLDRWEGDEGTNQALIDFWIEQALSPIDINQVRYDQLLNFAGVSPIDAAAIINYRDRVGQISSLRDLRNAPYLSYFGYRNTRDFVAFESAPPAGKREFHGHLLFRMTDTPFFTEEEDITATLREFSAPLIGISINDYPEVYTRLIGSYGNDLKVGLSYWHTLQEPIIRTDLGFAEIPRFKFYLGVENKRLGDLELRKLYVGNYSLAFGHGVIMENSDFFSPRKSGIGFRKRFIGLTGDNSRTRQYKLTGVAAEIAFKKRAHLFLFGAFDERDAILNRTPVNFRGEIINPVNQLLVLDQRFEFAPGDTLRINDQLTWRDSVKELLYGFHAAYDLFPTTQIGVTYYESAYDRPLRPDIEEIVNPGDLGQVTITDNEILNSYGGPVSDGENPFWRAAKSFRRIYGLDFQSVYEHFAFQAEYAELDKGESLALFGATGDNPWAVASSAYLQYNSFYLLGMYRNYQLGFDNPYQRSISNYRRFKRTIYEDFFYLQSGFYGQLYFNNPQPQAERGFYFLSRYQINRQILLSLEYDNWKRNADDISQFRLRGTLEFRPVFPIILQLRQKYQGRDTENDLSLEYFENSEFRGTLRFRLSRFSELGLFYMNNFVKFRPRPRFFYPTQTGQEIGNDNLAGNAGIPGDGLAGFFTHNFNEWLKIRGFLGYYRGFFWNFEDTQFIVSDSGNQGATRWWLSLYSRVSNHITMRLKYTRDQQHAITSLQARDDENEPITNPGRYYQSSLVQPLQDYYYFELNFNF